MAQFFDSTFSHFLPWAFFMAGLSGSLHCVGMCGGLVTATCHKPRDVITYQLGRLLGYLALGFFAGALGQIFLIQTTNPKLTLIPGLFLGLLFIYWGIQNYIGKIKSFPTPFFLKKIYSIIFSKLVINNKNISKSFFTGLISIFLPCGLLYGIVLGLVAFHHSFQAIITMFFFWLGTLPAMILAPSIIQKFLKPLQNKIPKAYALTLISIGLLTISYRVHEFQTANHQPKLNGDSSKHRCH